MDRKTDGWNEEIWGKGNICFRYCCSRYRDVLAMAPGCNLTIHKTIHSLVPLHCSTLQLCIQQILNILRCHEASWLKKIYDGMMKMMHDNWDIIRLPQSRHQYFDEYAVVFWESVYNLPLLEQKVYNCLCFFTSNITPCLTGEKTLNRRRADTLACKIDGRFC